MIHALLLLAPAALPCADDWPGFRGPGGRGVALEASPPVEWSEEENVRWKVDVPGKGVSSPVVFGDVVYVTTAVSTGKQKPPEAEQEEEGGDRRGRGGFGRGGFGRGRGGPIEEQDFLVLAYSRADGELLWQAEAGRAMPHEGTHPDGSYATPTLVTDGVHVIASFGSYGIHAFTLEGEPVWSKDLGDLSIQMAFGEGSSPVLVGKRLVVNWDHEGDSFIVALDKASGEELWRTERPRGTNWLTPIVAQVGDVTQVIVGATETVGYDVETGEELWSYGAAPAPPAPPAEGGAERGGRFGRGGRGGGGGGIMGSPAFADGLLFVPISARSGGEFRALDLKGAKGELEAEALVWSETRDVPRIPSPVVSEGILYATKSNSGILSAFDAATGERHYGPERVEGVENMYASLIVAGGRVYMAGRDGGVAVVRAGEEFETLAVNTLEDGFDASPAVVGGELFLRGREHLYCIADDGE